MIVVPVKGQDAVDQLRPGLWDASCGTMGQDCTSCPVLPSQAGRMVSSEAWLQHAVCSWCRAAERQSPERTSQCIEVNTCQVGQAEAPGAGTCASQCIGREVKDQVGIRSSPVLPHPIEVVCTDAGSSTRRQRPASWMHGHGMQPC